MPRVRHSLVGIVAVCLIAGTLVVPRQARAAVVLHVPAQYGTIAAAIAAAQPLDTVLVAPGTYFERLIIPDWITVASSAGPATTIIDGAMGGTVVRVNAGATVRGFTIRKGWESGGFAGGILLHGGIVEGNRIVDNYACSGGGGIWGHSGTIRNNYIARNSQLGCSGGFGGGILASGPLEIVDNTMEANDWGEGGAIGMNGVSPVIRRNIIRNNTAGRGAAIAMINDAQPLIENNLFVNNTAVAEGGAIYWSVPSGSSGPDFVNNTLVDNRAPEGPQIWANGYDGSTQAFNNVIVGATSAAAIHCTTLYTGTPQLKFNDVFNSAGPEYGGACSDQTGINGNLSVGAGFVDAAGGNYRLRPDSPLIDKGTNSGAPTSDVDEDARPQDGDENGVAIVDIGFDEAVQAFLADPAAVNFGNVVRADTSPALTVTLTNHAGPATVSNVAIGGSHPSHFAVSAESCTSAPIAHLGTCSISVQMTPTALGAKSALLVVTGPDPVGTQTIALTGNGLSEIAVAPASLNFGDAFVGAWDGPLTVTLTNRGNVPVSVTGVSRSGAHAADFSISSQTCTASPVPADGSCTVRLGFKASATGTRTATLTISGPGSVGTRAVPLTGRGIPPPSGVSWGSVYTPGGAYTWNYGGSLGRTVKDGVAQLHVAYNTPRIGNAWATDSGPYVGVYYTRSSNVSTWTTPVRLNPSNQHATMAGLTTSGSRVYATWVSQVAWDNYFPGAARALYVRVNSNHGLTGFWQSSIRLSSASGRSDFPTIAAYGNDVHIAHTDANTGSIRVVTSRNLGVNWTSQSIGSTTRATADGRTGVPSVGAYGATIVVAWLADNAGTVKARVSLDRGVTWGSTTTVGTQAIGFAHAAVRGSRVAVAWTTPDSVVLRQRTSGVWAAPMTIATLPAGQDSFPYAPSVVLQDTNRVGIAWAERENDLTRANLKWAESANGGGVWFQVQTLATSSTATRTLNDWPSVVWPAASARYVTWNGWTPNTTNYRLYLRRGGGTPASPVFEPTTWEPQASSADAPPADLVARRDRSVLRSVDVELTSHKTGRRPT